MPEEVQLRESLKGRVIIAMLKTNVHDHTIYKIRLNELRNLVEALGLTVVDEVVQTRYRPYEARVLGKGKVQEIAKKVKKHGVSLIVFYNLIKSSQKLALIQETGCDVIDRYELTLEIFDQMASDSLSKLQIESAKLEKLTPFYKLAANVHFTHDRPFFHSGGEYGFRAQLRELTRRRSMIRDQIQQLVNDKQRQIVKRRKLGYPTVCISGYYNAGKTSLFNALTGDNKPVSDRPFTTLSSKYQRRYIDAETSVLFIDTIGFVLDLDHRLIKSFQLNFEDIRSADLVILLFEVSDPALTLRLKLQEGLSLLKDIGVDMRRLVIVFNKVDKAPEAAGQVAEELALDRYDIPWIAVSAQKRVNLDGLLELISEKIKENRELRIEETPKVAIPRLDAPREDSVEAPVEPAEGEEEDEPEDGTELEEGDVDEEE